FLRHFLKHLNDPSFRHLSCFYYTLALPKMQVVFRVPAKRNVFFVHFTGVVRIFSFIFYGRTASSERNLG
ncbi:MAG: hypothetical protein K2N29_04560, partial [Ruminiclostridium sp.]|nr:hypothetical protein [Ruminiclostridium sp.]